MVSNASRYGLAACVGASLFLPLGSLGWTQAHQSARTPLVLAAMVVPPALLWLLQPLLWPAVSRLRALVTAVAVDALCWLVGVPALLFVGFAACAHKHTGPAWLAGFVVYVAMASYLLVSPRRAWLWPASVLLGLAVTGILIAATPSAYCYT
jgi:hypothetical protein